MISNRDGHIRVLPIHVANKIAAGEVVERPASVVKELVENSIDAGSSKIAISIIQGGKKLIAVRDDGRGMCKDDAVLSLERQATSKILDVGDIENIDTLGFRGEAIPSIASVSRFTLTTRTADNDEGTMLQVNAGILAEVRACGCPTGTQVEVRDLFCNVPARKKFLRSYATEENHIKQIFTVHALAHPSIGFSLTIDSRELYRLAPTNKIEDRVRELFGEEFLESLSPIMSGKADDREGIFVSGFIEKPNLSNPTRREQYIFVNGRPASAPSIAYALREAYPGRQGDVRPAAIIFISLPPNQVDVNVHPTKREVRFRDNTALKTAITAAIEATFSKPSSASAKKPMVMPVSQMPIAPTTPIESVPVITHSNGTASPTLPATENLTIFQSTPQPLPVSVEFAIEPDSSRSKPWAWFKVLAQSASGYLLIETDAGIVTINPHAARERIAYENMLANLRTDPGNDTPLHGFSQTLLIPEMVQLSPVDFARITASMPTIIKMGFQLETFGRDTFKVEAVPQLIGSISPSAVLSTIAKDLSESGTRRGGDRWKEERIAKSIAMLFAGASIKLTNEGATKLVEELCACKMPYVCPRGKPVMIFTSTRELDRRFSRA